MEASFPDALNYDSLPWERYRSRKASSGVLKYASIADDAIWVEFQDKKVYLYTGRSIGKAEVEEMKRRAITGNGLSTFINQHRTGKKGYEVRYEFKNGKWQRF